MQGIVQRAFAPIPAIKRRGSIARKRSFVQVGPADWAREKPPVRNRPIADMQITASLCKWMMPDTKVAPAPKVGGAVS